MPLAVRFDSNPPSIQTISATIQTGNRTAEVKYRLVSLPLYLVEKVADDFVTISRNADPLTVTGECADHASAGVCFPRSRWALDWKNAMVQIEGDPHSSRQRRLAIALERFIPKSRCDCQQKIAGGAMIPFAFDPIVGDVFSEPKITLGKVTF